MDFSKTYYQKNKLLLSSNFFKNSFHGNKSTKKMFYATNYKKFYSTSTSPTTNSSKNCITKSTLKSLNKLMSEKLENSLRIKKQLKSFHKQEIKYKIRFSNKYKSLFEKTEINDIEKNLINYKLKSNKRKFNYFYTNTNDNISKNFNINNSSNYMKKESDKSRISYEINNISKNLNKINETENINLSINFGESINKTHYSTNYFTKESNDINNNIRSQIIKNNESNKKYRENTKNSINNANIKLYRNMPPYSVDFSEKNLTNFYLQTKNLCYKKYFLHLQRTKLEMAKMKNDGILALNDLDYSKLMNFYKLFKPYNIYLERYIIFLNEKIYIEFKHNEKLKLIKSVLVNEFLNLSKNLLNLHKTLSIYLQDKFFLLCVKNNTKNLEKFSEKYKIEYKQDLQNLETLKIYINEISALTSDENMLKKNKNIEIHTNNNNSAKKNEISFSLKIKKIRDNFEASFKHDITSEKIFENTDDFYEHINLVEKKIDTLLKKDKEVEIEVANLRDYVSHHAIEIEKAKSNILLHENKYNKFLQDLSEIKKKNKYLINYSNKLKKIKKYNISKKIINKIKSLINHILEQNDKKVNKIILNNNKKIGENANLLLKILETVIIFLIKFKQIQKDNNTNKYNDIIKDIEKENRLMMIEKLKEKLKEKDNSKFRRIMEKNNKIFFIKDKRTNVKFKSLKKNLDENDKNVIQDDDEGKDLFY